MARAEAALALGRGEEAGEGALALALQHAPHALDAHHVRSDAYDHAAALRARVGGCNVAPRYAAQGRPATLAALEIGHIRWLTAEGGWFDATAAMIEPMARASTFGGRASLQGDAQANAARGRFYAVQNELSARGEGQDGADVLDYGAGRGLWATEDLAPFHRRLRAIEKRVLRQAVNDQSLRKVAANTIRAVLLLVGLLAAVIQRQATGRGQPGPEHRQCPQDSPRRWHRATLPGAGAGLRRQLAVLLHPRQFLRGVAHAGQVGDRAEGCFQQEPVDRPPAIDLTPTGADRDAQLLDDLRERGLRVLPVSAVRVRKADPAGAGDFVASRSRIRRGSSAWSAAGWRRGTASSAAHGRSWRRTAPGSSQRPCSWSSAFTSSAAPSSSSCPSTRSRPRRAALRGSPAFRFVENPQAFLRRLRIGGLDDV